MTHKHINLHWDSSKYPAKGSTWRHYKGNMYVVVGMCMDEESGEPRVLYKRVVLVDDPNVIPWGRKLSDWFSQTTTGEPRFVLTHT